MIYTLLGRRVSVFGIEHVISVDIVEKDVFSQILSLRLVSSPSKMDRHGSNLQPWNSRDGEPGASDRNLGATSSAVAGRGGKCVGN